jgi:hypothetical protein
MGRGIIKGLLKGLHKAAAAQPDTRGASNSQKYGITDFILSAFAVFYGQHPSMLHFQQEMERKHKRSNLQTLFGVKQIPGVDHIRKIVDGIAPEGLSGAFDTALMVAQEQGVLEEYRVLNGTIPVALDGVWYFSSTEIHCERCLRMEKKQRDGEVQTTYYHDVVAAAVVRPADHVVLPLLPEFIRNEDGGEKQDCERNAGKRWIEKNRGRYGPLKVTLLGDDLYACHPLCTAVQEAGMKFLFTCKEESHPWITEQVKYREGCTHEKRVWNGRHHLVHRYRWVNGIENRAEGEKLPVNYLRLELYNEEKGEVTYKNSWITDHEITKETAGVIAECGRARWKIENEHNNVLKHRGYNLEHNFGHGKEHASEIFCLLNLLAFLFHRIQDKADEEYREARGSFGRRDAFFWAFRYEINRYLHESWQGLFLTLAGNAPDG